MHELTLHTSNYMPVLGGCGTSNEIRGNDKLEWRVIKPYQVNCSGEECFTLPTLPPTFPRAAAGVQRRSGFEQRVGGGQTCVSSGDCLVPGEICVDPDGSGAQPTMCMGGTGTEADPYRAQIYSWKVHEYDLELAPSFDFNHFAFADRPTYLTHESVNYSYFE